MAFLGGYDEDDYYESSTSRFIDSIWGRWVLHKDLERSLERSKINQSLNACEDEDIPEITCDLSQQLSSHFNNPQFSDVTLRVKTKVYHVHKLILCAWSEVFSEMLSVDSKQGKTSAKITATCQVESDGIHTVLTLKEKDKFANVFEDFLKFMYTESVDLSDMTVYPIFKLANTYMVKDLSDLCQEFLIQKVSDDTGAAQRYLDKAESLGMTQLYKHCIDVFERNFDFIPMSCLIELSPQLFLSVIGSSKLVSNELYVLSIAFRWLTADGKEERQKHTEAILSLIRFAHIHPAQLKIASFCFLTSSKMYPKFKNIFQKLLHEAFEWLAIAEDDVFMQLPHHIQFSSFSRNFAPLRYYNGEPKENYSELLLKVQSDKETSSDDFDYPSLPFELMYLTQNNVLQSQVHKTDLWELDGSTFLDQEAKLWGIRYHLKPSSRDCEMKHAGKSFHAVILTASPKSGGSSKPTVSTFEGVTAKFGDEQEITVTLSPQLLRLKQKPTAVDVRVVFYLKLKHSELTNLKLRKPEEIPRCPQPSKRHKLH